MSNVVETGIKGLDDILVGGIPRGHSVLLAGSCGTGKTVIGFEYLFKGAQAGETGVYISLVEPSDKALRNIKAFSFYNQKVLDKGLLKVAEMTRDVRLRGTDFSDINELINIIRSVVEETKAKRVVVDSITALCESIGDTKRIRDFVLELGLQLMYLDCTTILISEIPPQLFKYSIYGVEEFIADGVILLGDFERKGELVRTLQVIKMRGVAHSRNKQVMKILDEGVNVISMFKSEAE
jgi:circadian clock protein KaiC